MDIPNHTTPTAFMASQRVNVERSTYFTLSRPYMSFDSDTYINESVNAYDSVRPDEFALVRGVPTRLTPIASSIAEMSFSNYSDKDGDGKLDKDIFINDNDFQLQQTVRLKQQKVRLKKQCRSMQMRMRM